MLLGAYTYAILTIPAASQKSIYQRYANGGIGFSIPELLSKPGRLRPAAGCCVLPDPGRFYRSAVRLPHRPAGAEAQERLSCHCYTGLCRDHPRRRGLRGLWPADQRLQPSVRLYQLCQLQPFAGRHDPASGNRDALPLLRHLHRHHSAAHQLHLWPCLQGHP